MALQAHCALHVSVSFLSFICTGVMFSDGLIIIYVAKDIHDELSTESLAKELGTGQRLH
jgi:hypothetical protein